MNGKYFRMIVRAIPPASVTTGGDPRNVSVISELTRHEIDAIDLVGLGVKIDHTAPDTYIGRVVETIKTPDGGLNLMLEIPPVRNRDTVVGQFMDLIKQTLIRNIEKGNYSTVSLCHQPFKPESVKVDGEDIIVYPREIREVSITEDDNNYRAGSDILTHYWSDAPYLGARFSAVDEYPKFMSHAAVRVRVDEWGNPPSDFAPAEEPAPLKEPVPVLAPAPPTPQETAYVEMLTRAYERLLTDERERELKNTANTPALMNSDDHHTSGNRYYNSQSEMSSNTDMKTNLTSGSTLPASSTSAKPAPSADDFNAMILKAEQLRKENELLQNELKETKAVREKEAKERELLTAIKDRYQQEQQQKIEENKKFLEESVMKEFDTTLKNTELVDADSDETKAEKQVLETGKTQATSALQNIFKNLDSRNPTCSDQDRELLTEMTRFFNTQNYALMAMNRKVHRAAKVAEESNQKKLEQIADSILAKRAAEKMNASSSAPAPDAFSIPQKRSGLDTLASSSSAAGTSKPRVDMEIIPFSNLMSKAMENVLEQRTIKKTRTDSE